MVLGCRTQVGSEPRTWQLGKGKRGDSGKQAPKEHLASSSPGVQAALAMWAHRVHSTHVTGHALAPLPSQNGEVL